MRADYSGQTAIFDPAAFTWPVHVIGVGGIGSALVLPLVKLGLRSQLHLWDPDEVEPHNIPCQMIYNTGDVGVAKVEAAKKFLSPFKEPSCDIITHQEWVTAETPFEGIVISGVDSMAARMAIWEGIRWNPMVPLYMDGRMGGEQVTLLTVSPCDPDSVDHYENPQNAWLLSDEESSDAPCAARTVIHPPVVLAGLMIAQLTRFVRDIATKKSIDFHVRETQVLVQ